MIRMYRYSLPFESAGINSANLSNAVEATHAVAFLFPDANIRPQILLSVRREE